MRPYYEEPGITIYHGDCHEILPQLTADVLLTDPPYGISRKCGTGFVDTVETFRAHAAWLVMLGYPMVMHLPHSRIYDIPKPQWRACWYKPCQVGGWMFSVPLYPHWEPLAIYHMPVTLWHRSDVFIADARRKAFGHPTEKALSIESQLLQWMPKGLVIDPFMGSAPVLRAAKDLGRQAIGIDIDERYCEIAVNRLRQGVLALGAD
jgi:DNA modification methylase